MAMGPTKSASCLTSSACGAGRPSATQPALNGKSGAFECVPPEAGNRGPVSVRDGFHFAYADGTPLRRVRHHLLCVGLSAGRHAAPDPRRLLPLRPSTSCACASSPSGTSTTAKNRRCIPFRATATLTTYSTFNVAYFQHFDRLILALGRIGVQADLILFHPYDKWGYQSMPAEVDDRYLRYVIARFSAYRNVWWSLANEFDLLQVEDHGRLGSLCAHPRRIRRLRSSALDPLQPLSI